MPALRITLLLSLHRDLRDSVGNANRTINLNVLKRLSYFQLIPHVHVSDRFIVAAAGGRGSTCALLSNGGVVCFGSNSDGELGLGSTLNVGGTPRIRGNFLMAVSVPSITGTNFGGYKSFSA